MTQNSKNYSHASVLSDHVQRTNDDAVLSKRSANKMGYFSDDYLRFFSKKLIRRAPLINRGYYLRVLAIRKIIQWFLDIFPDSHLQVVSLGCGYDTTPYNVSRSAGQQITFYDLDFPELLSRKENLLRNAGNDFSGRIPINETVPQDNDFVRRIQETNRISVGCDLRNTQETILKLTQSGFNPCHRTLYVAECVLQYLDSNSSERLLGELFNVWRGAVNVSENTDINSHFSVIFDQIEPYDIFGLRMRKTLKDRASPLLGIQTWGTIDNQEKRMYDAGWSWTKSVSFSDIADDLLNLVPEEFQRISSLEPFDEIEDWVETCRHYCFTFSATSHPIRVPFFFEAKDNSLRIPEYPSSSRNLTLSKISCLTRCDGYGQAALAHPLEATKVILFGGYSKGRRCNNLVIIDVAKGSEMCKEFHETQAPEPRMYHAMASIKCLAVDELSLTDTETYDPEILLFGGRKSPQDPLGDTLLLNARTYSWTKLINSLDSPCARYRHRMCSIPTCFCPWHNDSDVWHDSVLLFGGIGHNQQLLNDTWLFCSRKRQWLPVACNSQSPSPRHSFGMCFSPESNRVVISGGITENHIISDEIFALDLFHWVWSKLETTPRPPPLFSHTLTSVSYMITFIGGSTASRTYTNRNSNVLFLDEKSLCLTQGDEQRSVDFACGHQTVWIPTLSSLCIIGGGLQCFSFGSVYSTLRLLKFVNGISGLRYNTKLISPRSLREVRNPVSDEFWINNLYATRFPVVFRNQNMGDCIHKWCDPTYLSTREQDTHVSVHVMRPVYEDAKLNFVDRNFDYKTVPFPMLVNECFSATEKIYFRSLARRRSTTDFWLNFPELAEDFSVPHGFRSTVLGERYSQSCLRMSTSGVQLWTHYDIMDNILCQIVGTKRVVLYPPDQYTNLYMKDSVSTVLDIDNPDLQRFPRFADSSSRGYEVILEPGDILFIPSLWFHNVLALTPCVGINIFWRHLEKQYYDPLDTFGNRDLPCMVNARKHISAEIQNALDSVPADYRQFLMHQIYHDMERQILS